MICQLVNFVIVLHGFASAEKYLKLQRMHFCLNKDNGCKVAKEYKLKLKYLIVLPFECSKTIGNTREIIYPVKHIFSIISLFYFIL